MQFTLINSEFSLVIFYFLWHKQNCKLLCDSAVSFFVLFVIDICVSVYTCMISVQVCMYLCLYMMWSMCANANVCLCHKHVCGSHKTILGISLYLPPCLRLAFVVVILCVYHLAGIQQFSDSSASFSNLTAQAEFTHPQYSIWLYLTSRHLNSGTYVGKENTSCLPSPLQSIVELNIPP